MNINDKMVHAVTEWDRKQITKRGYNPYALGIYLQRVDEVSKDIEKGTDPRKAIAAGFSDRLVDFILKQCGLTQLTVDEHRNAPLTY